MKALLFVLCLSALSHAHAFEIKESRQPLAQFLEMKPDSTGVSEISLDSIKKLSQPSGLSETPRQDRNDHRDQRRNRVYCDYYSDNNTSGYSIFRRRDGQDIGNAVWLRDRYECDDAASLANRVREGIVCAKYYNRGSATLAYSVYRIHDNVDLGKATISDFYSCQAAVRSARYGVFCSTYVQNGRTWWSPYDIRTGSDLGTNLYSTIEACERSI